MQVEAPLAARLLRDPCWKPEQEELTSGGSASNMAGLLATVSALAESLLGFLPDASQVSYSQTSPMIPHSMRLLPDGATTTGCTVS
jgi:hypothetical protein